MTPDERKKLLDSVSIEDIDERFHRGHLWADHRNNLLRAKAKQTVEDMLGDKGYMGAVLEKTLENLQEGWDAMKQSFKDIPPTPKSSVVAGETLSEHIVAQAKHAEEVFKQSAKGVWGMVQVLGSAISALGTVNGTVAEQWALGKGASPGLAKAIGFSADMGSGFVPVGLAYRTGVQAAGGAIRGIKAMGQARRLAKAGEMVAEAQKVDQATQAMEQVEAVIKSGLELEGVKMPTGPEGSRRWAVGDTAMVEGTSVRVMKVPPHPDGLYEVVNSGTEGKGVTMHYLGEDLSPVTVHAPSAPPVPPDARTTFEADLKAFRAKIQALTETQTHAQTQAMANRLGLTLEDLHRLVPGAALNEKEMLAYLNALDPMIEEAITLAKAATNGGVPETQAFMQHMSKILAVAPIFRGAEVTAGRAVEILKETPPMKAITDMLMEMQPEKIAQGDFHGAAQAMAENILAAQQAGKNRAKLALLEAQQRGRTSLWGGFMEWYKNLLLALPVSAIRDIAGNSMSITTNLINTQIGGIFSASKDGLEFGSAWYKIKGMHLALAEAMKVYTDTLKGSPINVAGSSIFDANIAAQIPGPAGTVIRTPGNARRAADNWFKTLIRSGSLYEQGMRMAHQQGLRGEKAAEFAAKRRVYPTEEMNKIADQDTLYQTFQNELGTFGKWARQGLQYGPLAMAFPFVKTSIDLKKWAWNHTPGLQMLSKSLWNDIAEGGVKADMAIGRLTWATMQGMFLYQLAQEGVITGSGPIDPALNKVWREMGNERYSVKTPWGHVSFSNMDPASTIWGALADFAQVHNQLADPVAEQTAMALTFSIMHNMTQNSWWPTMNRLVDVVTGVNKGQEPGWKTLEVMFDPLLTVAAGPVGAAASLATGGSKEALLGATGGPIAARAARALDPIHRETRNIVDEALNQVPGYSKTLRASRDDLGRPIVPPQAVGGPWLSFFIPLTVRPYEKDPRAKALVENHVAMPKWPDRVGMKSTPEPDAFQIKEPQPGDRFGADLTQAELMRRDELYKEHIDDPKLGLAAQVLNAPGFMTDPNGEPTTGPAKKAQIERYLHSARDAASQKLAIESPTLVPRIMRSQASNFLPLVGPKAQDKLQEQLGLSIQLWEKMAPEVRDNVLRWGTPPDGENQNQ